MGRLPSWLPTRLSGCLCCSGGACPCSLSRGCGRAIARPPAPLVVLQGREVLREPGLAGLDSILRIVSFQAVEQVSWWAPAPTLAGGQEMQKLPSRRGLDLGGDFAMCLGLEFHLGLHQLSQECNGVGRA